MMVVTAYGVGGDADDVADDELARTSSEGVAEKSEVVGPPSNPDPAVGLATAMSADARLRRSPCQAEIRATAIRATATVATMTSTRCLPICQPSPAPLEGMLSQ
jgi:hypothetical protein